MDRFGKAYSPWRDDSMVPGESVYSLWNKISWYGVAQPIYLLWECRSPSDRLVTYPHEVNFGNADCLLGNIEHSDPLPMLGGTLPCVRLRQINDGWRRDVPARWRCESLRFCPECIASGVHLNLHQHLGLSVCPVHDAILRTRCPRCHFTIPYSCKTGQRAFSCPRCGFVFLGEGMIEFSFPPNVRQLYVNADDKFRAWLPSLATLPSVSLGRMSSHWFCGCPASHLDPRNAELQVLRSNAGRQPRYEVGTRSTRVVAELVRFRDLAQARGKVYGSGVVVGAFRRRVKYDRTLSACELSCVADRDQADALVAMCTCYHMTLLRVTEAFLRRVMRDHVCCLFRPDLVAGADAIPPNDMPRAVLDCCSVALGFWLWRKRSAKWLLRLIDAPGQFFETLGVRRTDVCLDLVLYALERSHLHACILVASECCAAWRRSHDWGLGLWTLEESLAASSWDLETGGAGCKLLRIDASWLIRALRCPEQRGPRRRVTTAPGTGSPHGLLPRHELASSWVGWLEYARREAAPFCGSSDDWMFFKVWSPRHRWDRALLRTIFSQRAIRDSLRKCM